MNYLTGIKAISFFSTSLCEKESTEEVLWSITKNVVNQLGLIDCVIYEFDSTKKVLIQRAAYGKKNLNNINIYKQINVSIGKGIVGSVAKNKQAEIISDTSQDTRYIIDDARRYSELCVPILINDKLFGVIDSEHPEKHFFTEEHLHLFTIIATLCGQKIKELRNQTKKVLTKENQYFKKLELQMMNKRIYKNPNLSLETTAKLLGISGCYLSRLINSVLKMSFTDYINKYRITDVKKYLQNDQYSHYTILSIGLEAGFNSKSVFYNAFKKYTGISPSEYKENIQNVSLFLTS